MFCIIGLLLFFSSKVWIELEYVLLAYLNPTNSNICQIRESFSLANAASCISVRSASWVAADNTDGKIDIIWIIVSKFGHFELDPTYRRNLLNIGNFSKQHVLTQELKKPSFFVLAWSFT